jgi:hypothetical protein
MTVFKNRKLMKTRNILIAILALAVANTFTEGWLNIAGIALLSASLVPVAIKMDKADR